LHQLLHGESPEERNKVLEGMRKVASGVLNTESPPDAEIESLRRGLSSLCLDPPYREELGQAHSIAAVQACRSRILKDATSLMDPNPPVQISRAGTRGPTLLVHFLRLNSERQTETRTSVIKWTSGNEIQTHRVCLAFSKILFTGFRVPSIHYSIVFPPETNPGIELPEGEFLSLSGSEMAAKLEANYRALREACKSEVNPENSRILIAERIQGQNMIDFIQRSYATLRLEQKNKFFERIGRLAFLDLAIIGTFDRLVQVTFQADNDEWSLDNDLEANLDNIMTDWTPNSEDPPVLFAIDNLTLEELLEKNPHKRGKYCDFLKCLLKSETMVSDVASHIMNNLVNALCDISTDPGSPGALFKADVQKLGPPLFAAGIAQMDQSLRSDLIPAWLRDAHLHAYLKGSNPELFEGLQERATTYMDIRGSL
jgi:hypothetical protein